MATSMKEAFIRSAKARAIIMAELRRLSPHGLAFSGIQSIESLKEVGISEAALRSCVYSMTKAGLVTRRKLHGVNSYYASTAEVPTSSPAKLAKPVKATPAIQVDIIKATGRVRLFLNGLVIEIGVE